MREFQYVVISFHGGASAEPVNWGVLLVDPVSEKLHFKFRTAFPPTLVTSDDAELIEELAEHLVKMANESGAEALLRWLLDTTSNAVQVTDRLRIEAPTAKNALRRAVRNFLE